MATTKTQLGVARWNQDSKSASVVKTVGKYMNAMGFKDEGQHLFPEEIVFLVDRDETQLVMSNGEDDHIMSKLETFALLADCVIDMKVYTVYAVLREQRFHVFRQNAWQTQPRLWKSLAAPLLNSSNELDDLGENPTCKRIRVEKEGVEPLTVAFDVYKPQANFPKNKMSKPDFCIAVLSAEDAMPSIQVIRETINRLPIGVPLRLAITADSSVTFVEVSDFVPIAAISPTIPLHSDASTSEDMIEPIN